MTADYTMGKDAAGNVQSTTTVGAEQKVSDQLALKTAVTMAQAADGSRTTTTAVGAQTQVGQATTLQTTVAMESSAASQKMTTTIGGTTQVDDSTQLTTAVSMTGDQAAGQTTSLTVDATKQLEEGRQTTGSVKIDQLGGAQVTTIGLTDAAKLTDELQMIAERTFGTSDAEITRSDRYGLIRAKDGKTMEASVTRQLALGEAEVSESNIFGLSGNVTDRLAISGSYERGEVQSLDGVVSLRDAIAFGMGYVYKDPETGEEMLKSSTKVEVRMDDGATDKLQYLFYNATEGRISDRPLYL
jgi:hypothetical protein